MLDFRGAHSVLLFDFVIKIDATPKVRRNVSKTR